MKTIGILLSLVVALSLSASTKSLAQTGPGTGTGGQPPYLTTWQDYECFKELICVGAATYGECKSQGTVCHSRTCEDENDPNYGLGCSWEYDWECLPAEGFACTHTRLEGIGPDCGPNCDLITYGVCACSCEDLGPATVEGGSYAQCNTSLVQN